ncbi:hypothetical protein HZS_5696 [Henneguya salminicola]|nr:hypothetical protein HZS_5696 [Henneguya salminicola]
MLHNQIEFSHSFYTRYSTYTLCQLFEYCIKKKDCFLDKCMIRLYKNNDTQTPTTVPISRAITLILLNEYYEIKSNFCFEQKLPNNFTAHYWESFKINLTDLFLIEKLDWIFSNLPQTFFITLEPFILNHLRDHFQKLTTDS